MGVSQAQVALWIAAILLEVLLFGILLFRKWQGRIPFFATYIGLVIASELFVFCLYRVAGYRSVAALYGFWLAQLVVLVARAAAIGEVAWNASRPYPGFRVIVRWTFVIVGCFLLLRALLVSLSEAPRLSRFVLALQSGLELAATALLLLLLALGIRYEVSLFRVERWLALGLLFYSAIQVANNALTRYSTWLNFSEWNLIRTVSFHVTLLIWILAVAWGRQEEQMDDVIDTAALRDFVKQGTAASEEMLEQLKTRDGGASRTR